MEFPCPSCHVPVSWDAVEKLRPGLQFILTCPSCGYHIRGGVGRQVQQGIVRASQQEGLQNQLMSYPETPDDEDATARAMLPPVFL